MYRFGYIVEGSDTPVMLSSTFAGANTITSDTLPAGTIWPVVVARDLVNGDSKMVVATTNVTICVTAALCDGSSNGTDAGAATEAMRNKLDAQVENLASSPEDVAANKNKLATVLLGVAQSINEVTATSSSNHAVVGNATTLRTKMANTLRDAVMVSGGPALDVGTAASALASISANPEQLSSAAQAVIDEIIDGILDKPSVISNGLDSEVAQNLVATVGSTQQASTTSRRKLVSNKMMSQLKAITIAALKQTEIGSDALTLAGSGLSLAMRKLKTDDLGSSRIGLSSLYDGWGFQMSPGFTLTGPASGVVFVQALRSSAAYASAATQEAVSPVVSLSIWDASGTLLSVTAGSVVASVTLSNKASSPSCQQWGGSSWLAQPGAMTTTNRARGASIDCNFHSLGSFVVINTCNPSTTCSNNGECTFDGTCSCKIGWAGPNCATQYCDSALFPCANGGVCKCTAEPYDCVAHCIATAGCSQTVCADKCPPGGKSNYTLASCPILYGGPQTECQCPCGYSGPRCESAAVGFSMCQ
jgi:hypothetical protein